MWLRPIESAVKREHAKIVKLLLQDNRISEINYAYKMAKKKQPEFAALLKSYGGDPQKIRFNAKKKLASNDAAGATLGDVIEEALNKQMQKSGFDFEK